MKYNKKNRAVISGLLVGLASIYAVASYFDVGMAELNDFLLYTLLMVAGIVLLALLAVVALKLAGRLFGLLRRHQDDSPPHDRE